VLLKELMSSLGVSVQTFLSFSAVFFGNFIIEDGFLGNFIPLESVAWELTGGVGKSGEK